MHINLLINILKVKLQIQAISLKQKHAIQLMEGFYLPHVLVYSMTEFGLTLIYT